jgi:hypothetical protein
VKRKVLIFRVVLMTLSVAIFFYGAARLESGEFSAGMYWIATAVGGLAYSNILNLETKTTLSDAIQGKTRWPLTPIGQVLQLAYFILLAISGWLWLKYG